ncbi:LuxR family transcriptional regulator [Nocardioides immobilis]|uniref:LuxR family transcriptional regulator n=1 Tax=Nocardioides immobilis TaxID=2049295 RepID=A0A417XRZ9_9ACTN|nr:helix-turn-helix transcriptional regulator [Nocardioides immobilis]RHW23229.1 LuxR family transcriptional regulator [Nocardioides immobilis]
MSESMRTPLAPYGVQRRHLQVVPVAPPSSDATAPLAPAPGWADRLSSREVEVLQCIAAGLSTNEIAETLFISTATVKSHIARLICKVEVRDRLQLVIAAYRSGFVRVS